MGKSYSALCDLARGVGGYNSSPLPKHTLASMSPGPPGGGGGVWGGGRSGPEVFAVKRINICYRARRWSDASGRLDEAAAAADYDCAAECINRLIF